MPSSNIGRRSSDWSLAPLGDGALLVQSVAPDQAAVGRLVALAQQLERVKERHKAFRGVTGWTLGLHTLLVTFDPLAIDDARLGRWLLRQLRSLAAVAHADALLVEIPVRYGGEEGPDLAAVAQATGLDEDEVITIHSGGSYQVLMIGFAPGFPYIGGLPQQLHLPRRAVPRTAVPLGSVAIAGDMVGIYPQRSPGGWHVIGRTTLAMFDPRRDPPALLQPGDRVHFVAV